MEGKDGVQKKRKEIADTDLELREKVKKKKKRRKELGSSSSRKPKAGTSWMLDKLSGLQKTLLNIVASSSPSSVESLPPDFPRPKQISDYIYEVCKPTHGRPSVELVFFHGLQLEGLEEAHMTTWMSQDRSELWLNWLVEDFPNARILIISYDAASKRTSSKGNTDMYITRENLVHSLIGMEARVGQDGCPVVLVGHCLGGLVMKELCVQADSMLSQDPSNEALENLLWNIKGFFSYATPHQGSGMADNTNTECPMGLLFKDMTILNKITARRNEDFRKLRKKYEWRTFGVGENREVNMGNFEGFVVLEASARHDTDLFYTIDADHFQISRPESRVSSSYQRIKYFIGDVLKEDTNRFPPEMDLPAEFVGLESHTKRIEEVLRATQRLGIVGMGGIGKTTLAKALFDEISGKFEYACFLYKVKHSMTANKQPSDLRKTIIDNLYCHGRKVSTRYDWKTLRKKRVLIILDDAESESQIDVMTETDGFSKDSRLIVTSRDKGFLIPLDFDFHMVEGLSLDDSKLLFCLHAFKKRIAPNSYEEQVMKFAKKCGGLPLALKVSGRYLYSRKIGSWDDAFKKLGLAESLNGSREDGLWSILRVSYDSLARTEQKMFLDAATVFHGEHLTSVQPLWRACGWAAESGWENLVDRCLVTIDKWRGIDMHEALRDLGQSMACPDPEDVTTHTRVSDIKTANQLCDVLSSRRQQGQGTTAKVEVLSLICDGTCDHFDISVIQDLEHLRILWVKDLNLSGSIGVVHNKLSVLKYRFHEHRYTQRGTAGGGLPKAIEKLVSLRFLDIFRHHGLFSLPEAFGHLRALEELRLTECMNLVELPDSIGQLQELRDLEIKDCPLRSLPETFGQLRALRNFEIIYCRTLRTLPESFGDLCSLESLRITDCGSLIELPQSVGKLRALQYLRLDTKFLAAAPLECLGQLQALRHLEIGFCLASFGVLPESLWQSRTLECLRIREDHFPQEYEGLADYEDLYDSSKESGVQELEIISESLGHLQALKYLSIVSVYRRLSSVSLEPPLTKLPVSLGQLVTLKQLEIRDCPELEALSESLGQLQALECLILTGCNSLRRLPESLGQLGALRRLEIISCDQLEALPKSIGRLEALEQLFLWGCKPLKHLPESLGQLRALKQLRIGECDFLEALPESLGQLHTLELLELRSCWRMENLPESLWQLGARCELRIDTGHNLKFSQREFLRQLGALRVSILDNQSPSILLDFKALRCHCEPLTPFLENGMR